MSESDPSPVESVSQDSAPASRMSRLLLSWRLWLVMLFVGLAAILFTVSMPVYRRMRAFEYLDAHEIEYELTDDNAWAEERLGRWGRGLRRVRAITAYRIDDAAGIAHIGEFQEVKELTLWGTVPLSESSIDALTSLTRVEQLMLGHANFTDEHLVRWFSRRPPLKGLSLVRSAISQRGLYELSRLATLEAVILTGTTLTDADFRDLKSLPNLHTFCISEGALGARAGDWVAGGMPRLRYLSIDQTLVSADFWRRLAECTELEAVLVEDCSLTSEALRFVSQAPNIVELRLDRSHIDADGLEHIGLMPKLRRLSCERCIGLTDSGVSHLGSLAALEDLDLDECSGLTDACVPALDGIPNLKSLSLPPEAITLRSIESFRRMPSLENVATNFALLEDQEVIDIVLEEW
jgi:hypothetical protein